MLIHMDQEATLPESDKILNVVNFLAKQARKFVLDKLLRVEIALTRFSSFFPDSLESG